MHMARARLFRGLGNGDSTEAEIAAAILTARAIDRSSLSAQNYVYEPKAQLEFAFGSVCEDRDDFACARQAYGRSLQEDLAFFPAHLRLARLALAVGDTADAQSELALAGDAAPDDPYALAVRGIMLAQLSDFSDARAAFTRLIAREPDFAGGYLLRARLDDLDHHTPEAVESYNAYLMHAPRSATDRADVASRLATLQPGAPR